MKKDVSTCRMPGSRGYVPDGLPNHLVMIPCWGAGAGVGVMTSESVSSVVQEGVNKNER